MDRLMARLSGDFDPLARFALTVTGDDDAAGGGGEDTLDSDVSKAIAQGQDEGSETGEGDDAGADTTPSDTGKDADAGAATAALQAKVRELEGHLGSRTEENRRLLGAIKNITGGDRPSPEQMTTRKRIVGEVVKQAKELANDPERAEKIYDRIFGGVEDVARDVVRAEMERATSEQKAYATAKASMVSALEKAGLGEKFFPMAERIAQSRMHTDPEWFVRTPGPDQFTAIIEEIKGYLATARGSKDIQDANERKRKEHGGTIPAGTKKPAGAKDGGEDEDVPGTAVEALARIKKDSRDRSKRLYSQTVGR